MRCRCTENRASADAVPDSASSPITSCSSDSSMSISSGERVVQIYEAGGGGGGRETPKFIFTNTNGHTEERDLKTHVYSSSHVHEHQHTNTEIRNRSGKAAARNARTWLLSSGRSRWCEGLRRPIVFTFGCVSACPPQDVR